MKYYLYRFSDNWADEMDLEGFAILTELEKKTALASIKKEFRNGGSIDFGTNEDNEYDSLEDVMACITFKTITSSEYYTIKKVFGGTTMGETGPLNGYDFDDDDDDVCEQCGDELDTDGQFCSNCEDVCEECGDSLNGEDGPLCSDCEEDEADEHEEEFKNNANSIRDFIKKEYGLEESEQLYKFYSRFTWKPTPKTEIEIIIEKYSGGGESVEITLRFNNKGTKYRDLSQTNFGVEEYCNSTVKIGSHIRGLIEKAKKY